MPSVEEKRRLLPFSPHFYLLGLWFLLFTVAIIAKTGTSKIQIVRGESRVEVALFPYSNESCLVTVASKEKEQKRECSVETLAPKSGTVLLDLNRATAKELKKIKGIGDVLASRIIAERERVGSFATLSELLKVKGIGKKKLAMIKKQATVVK